MEVHREMAGGYKTYSQTTCCKLNSQVLRKLRVRKKSK